MNLGQLIIATQPLLEIPLVLGEQREYGVLVPLEAVDTASREMNDQDVGHAHTTFCPVGNLGCLGRSLLD